MTVAAGSGSSTTPPGTYCLQSPRSTAQWTYPSLVTCSSASTTPALQWKAYGNTGDFATSYRIQDVDGNCLAAGDPNGGPSEAESSRVEPRTGRGLGTSVRILMLLIVCAGAVFWAGRH